MVWKKLVLNNVSFNIPTGNICGLFGLNGAGKSTLMKIITSLVSSKEGEVFYNGKRYEREEQEVSIGYMIENPVFYPELSGFNNLLLLASLYDNISRDRVNEIIDIVGLTESKNVKFKKYSLGMKQRLYFAYAIIDSPQILILDEPFNGIDPITCKLFKDLIIEMAKKGCTILISSHVISDVKEISDKVIIIDNGNIVYDSPVQKEDDLEEIFISKVTNAGKAQ